MSPQHPDLAQGRWRNFSLVEQMANIGSEVERSLNWKAKKNMEYAARAFDRALELLNLTLSDPKNRGRLREVARVREVFADFFVGENEFRSTAESWKKYFLYFAIAARHKV